MSDYPERCTICKRTREHGIHRYAVEGSMARHPDYHEFAPPSDSAMTADAIKEVVTQLYRAPSAPTIDKVAAVVKALTTERTKLAADLARAEKEAKRWEHLAMGAWKRADEAYNASLTDNLNCRAAEAKSARLEEAAKDVQADLIAYMLAHAADYSSAGPSVEQYKEMIARLQAALTLPEPSHET